MSLATWLGFLLAAVMIAVTPGPGAVLSMSTGGRHGYWAAFIAILGLQVAILLHLLIVAVGFGALLAASEQQRRQLHAVANDKRASALGTAELVGG